MNIKIGATISKITPSPRLDIANLMKVMIRTSYGSKIRII